MAKLRTKYLALLVGASLTYWIALPLVAMAFTVGIIPGDCFGCEALKQADLIHFRWSLVAILVVYMIALGAALRSKAPGRFN